MEKIKTERRKNVIFVSGILLVISAAMRILSLLFGTGSWTGSSFKDFVALFPLFSPTYMMMQTCSLAGAFGLLYLVAQWNKTRGFTLGVSFFVILTTVAIFILRAIFPGGSSASQKINLLLIGIAQIIEVGIAVILFVVYDDKKALKPPPKTKGFIVLLFLLPVLGLIMLIWQWAGLYTTEAPKIVHYAWYSYFVTFVILHGAVTGDGTNGKIFAIAWLILEAFLSISSILILVLLPESLGWFAQILWTVSGIKIPLSILFDWVFPIAASFLIFYFLFYFAKNYLEKEILLKKGKTA